jgi:hypothetical protein
MNPRIILLFFASAAVRNVVRNSIMCCRFDHFYFFYWSEGFAIDQRATFACEFLAHHHLGKGAVTEAGEATNIDRGIWGIM